MPTVTVKKDALYKAIGQTFTDEQFDDLCFEFGVELEITTEKELVENEQGKKGESDLSTEILFKIEVPANRYDLLCLEGIAMALRIFLQKERMPQIRALNVLPFEERKLIVEKTVSDVRPFGLSAILRGIKFDDEKLKNFMDLQDKLHNNICRGRKLVSMGTHDLDTVKGPFYYRGLKPEEMKFVPLNRTQEVDGHGMIKLLKDDPKLSKYLYLIEDKPLFPAMMDSNGVIMSVPPIINSQHTKMTINTTNVLIDITGLDLTKSEIVLNVLIAMFSIYCEKPFTVEEVEVISEGNAKIYPDLKPKIFKADVNYLRKISGVPSDLSITNIIRYLQKMELDATQLNENEIEVSCPITRSDILHPCDIAEDLSISYGYNNIEKKEVDTICHGKQQPYNKLGDMFRQEMAMGGYVECLTMALLSFKDQFNNLLFDKPDDKTVRIGYSACKEFECFRNSLIPCILKCVASNKTVALPIKIFELNDVVVIDPSNEVGACNRRKLCFAYSNISSSLEILQGMVDTLMKKIGLNYKDKDPSKRYKYTPANEKMFFPDRQANIEIFDKKKIGIFGIIHPKVLKNFGIVNPVTLCEIDVQEIFDLILKGELLEGFV